MGGPQTIPFIASINLLKVSIVSLFVPKPIFWAVKYLNGSCSASGLIRQWKNSHQTRKNFAKNPDRAACNAGRPEENPLRAALILGK